MRKLKTFAVTIAAVSTVLALAGCSAPAVSPGTAAQPQSVSALGYDLFHIDFEGSVVTCFEDGAYSNRVLTCFEGSQDVPPSELLTVEELGYEVSYVEAGNGITVACFEDGAYKNRVLTCFPQTSEGTVASE